MLLVPLIGLIICSLVVVFDDRLLLRLNCAVFALLFLALILEELWFRYTTFRETQEKD